MVWEILYKILQTVTQQNKEANWNAVKSRLVIEAGPMLVSKNVCGY